MYYLWGVLIGILVVAPSSLNPDPTSDQNCHFDTRFQTRPLKSILFFRPCLYAEIMSWLLRSEHKQKIYSNTFRIRIFLFLSFSFGIDTINTFIRSRCSLENHTRSQRKIFPFFRLKRSRNHSFWGGTYLYGLYKGFFHPPPPPGTV